MALFQYFKGKMIAFYKIFTELWNFQNTLSWALKFVRSEVHAVESYFLLLGSWPRVTSIAAEKYLDTAS